MPTITDLWFVSVASLDEIAAGIGLVDVHADEENYWTWVIGTHPELDNVQLDLTRTHTVPAGETDTRIFIWGDRPKIEMPDALVELVAARLGAMGITPVHAGRWVYLRGEDFDRVVARTIV